MTAVLKQLEDFREAEIAGSRQIPWRSSRQGSEGPKRALAPEAGSSTNAELPAPLQPLPGRPRCPDPPAARRALPAPGARRTPPPHSPFLGRLWITFTAASNLVACREPVSAMAPAPHRFLLGCRAASGGAGSAQLSAPLQPPARERCRAVPSPSPFLFPGSAPAPTPPLRRGRVSPPSTPERPRPHRRPAPRSAQPDLRPGLRRPCYVSHSGSLPFPPPAPPRGRGGTPGNVVSFSLLPLPTLSLPFL